MTDNKNQPNYLTTLLQLGQTLNSSLDLSQVLHVAIDKVVEFVQAERGFILLVEEGSHRVWGKATREIDPQQLEAVLSGRDDNNEPQVSRTIIEQALKQRSPVVSLNAMEDPRFAKHTSVRLAQVRSVLCVPLMAQGRTLGIVYLDNRAKSGVFDDHHVEMLTAFANQAAVAIENARLYENLRKSLEERLRLQTELHEKETQRLALEEANRLKSDYIGYISHELRNPLTTIRGYIQTLSGAMDLKPTARREFYETIEAEADRIRDLLTQFLDTSRLEAGRPITLNPREMDMDALLQRIGRAQRFHNLWTSQHTLVLDIAPDLPRIEADEDKIHQVMTNLLTNAIKYSPEGGNITIAAQRSADGDGVEIHIGDQGLGMSQEQQARLFGRFERIERPDIQQIAGTGLGLFLTRHLVELHGGEITCESELGKGATFTVTLPAHPSRFQE